MRVLSTSVIGVTKNIKKNNPKDIDYQKETQRKKVLDLEIDFHGKYFYFLEITTDKIL